MENTSTRKGGPPRHLHHNQDEWFYVIRGEYIIEIGSERLTLSEGDSILAPRQIPHAYAFVGTTPGKLLLAYASADKIEAYFRNRRTGSTYNEVNKRALGGVAGIVGAGENLGALLAGFLFKTPKFTYPQALLILDEICGRHN